MNCPICNQDIECSNISQLFLLHVRSHHGIKKSKDFYDQVLRKENEGVCVNCGKPTKFQGLKRGYSDFCSRSCYYQDKTHIIKRQQTINKKYGSMNGFVEHVKNIKKEKYGDENYNNSSKQISTMISRYGEDYMETFHAKTRIRNQKKYNCDFPLQNSDIYQKTKESKQKRICWQIQQRLPEGYTLVQKTFKYQSLFHIQCPKCNSISVFNRKPLEYRLDHNMEICYQCLPKDLKTSSMERQLKEYVETTLNQTVVSRFVKEKNEIDIYVPEKKFGVEMNGLYYHSDLFKSADYHKNKTEYFAKEGIRLIQIYEDEWIEKSHLVKSLINCFLNVDVSRIYGRKTIVRPVSYSEEKSFLDNNHIQGYIPSKYAFGLYHNDQLVSCITLGSPRFKNKIYDYELLRFCNMANMKVIGGFSKLWKYAVEHLSIQSTISYCDKRLFTGDVYLANGFELHKETTPNYYWCYGNQRFNRFKFRKSELKESSLTEDEQMRKHKYQKIYNCGNKVFVWSKNGKEKK
jgi:hypothetical protein